MIILKNLNFKKYKKKVDLYFDIKGLTFLITKKIKYKWISLISITK